MSFPLFLWYIQKRRVKRRFYLTFRVYLRDRLTAGHMPLKHVILVRIQVPQHFKNPQAFLCMGIDVFGRGDKAGFVHPALFDFLYWSKKNVGRGFIALEI